MMQRTGIGDAGERRLMIEIGDDNEGVAPEQLRPRRPAKCPTARCEKRGGWDQLCWGFGAAAQIMRGGGPKIS
jgi:hypothetical protein